MDAQPSWTQVQLVDSLGIVLSFCVTFVMNTCFFVDCLQQCHMFGRSRVSLISVLQEQHMFNCQSWYVSEQEWWTIDADAAGNIYFCAALTFCAALILCAALACLHLWHVVHRSSDSLCSSDMFCSSDMLYSSDIFRSSAWYVSQCWHAVQLLLHILQLRTASSVCSLNIIVQLWHVCLITGQMWAIEWLNVWFMPVRGLHALQARTKTDWETMGCNLGACKWSWQGRSPQRSAGGS